MEIIGGKRYINMELIDQIVNLFKCNYNQYHYEAFQSKGGIINLFSDRQFECLILYEQGKVLGFAGYYIKNYFSSNILEILLAHLLVDENYRGKGYGSLLEKYRLELIEKIKKPKVIYASCVENPRNSIQSKIKRNFYMGGFRYQYRPGKFERTNSVVMIYTGGLHKKICIECPSNLTQKVMKIGNPEIYFKDAIWNNSYTIKKINEQKLGRIVCHIFSNDRKGEKIDDYFLKILEQNKEKYIAVYLSPAIQGFKYIDKILINNSFYPLSYIPYIGDGAGIIEYQYVEMGIKGILKDHKISNFAKEYLDNLINLNYINNVD